MFHQRRTREFLMATAITVLAPATGFALDLSGSLGEGGLTHYVSGITNPVFNETPYITSEVRPLWIHQNIPSDFVTGGGDIDVLAVQLRVAITDRLGFIATKDGWADIDWDNALDDESGFANLAAGLKYAVISDPETNTLLTVGARYEAPTGSLKSSGIRMQGGGDGLFDLFVTGGRAWGNFGLQASIGSQLAVDNDYDMSFLHYSLHADYAVCDYFIPTFEMNGFTSIGDGNRTAVGVNGVDLVNLGSANTDTIITMAPGVRAHLLKNVDVGAAFELPVTDEEDVMDWRVTTDVVVHL